MGLFYKYMNRGITSGLANIGFSVCIIFVALQLCGFSAYGQAPDTAWRKPSSEAPAWDRVRSPRLDSVRKTLLSPRLPGMDSTLISLRARKKKKKDKPTGNWKKIVLPSFSFHGRGVASSQGSLTPGGVPGGEGQASIFGSAPAGSTPLNPPNYARLQLDGNVTAFGLPLAVGGFLTTEQTPERQRMDRFYIRFDPSAYNKRLDAQIKERAERLRKELEGGPAKIRQLAEKKLDDLEKSLGDSEKPMGGWEKTFDKFKEQAEKKLRSESDSLLNLSKRREALQQKLDSLKDKGEDKFADARENAEEKADSSAKKHTPKNKKTPNKKLPTDKAPGKEKLAKAQTKRAALEDSLKKIDETRQKVEARVKRWQSRKDSLESVYQKKRAKIDSLAHQADTLRARLENLEDSLKAKEAELKQLDTLQKALRAGRWQDLRKLPMWSKWQKRLLAFRRIEIGTTNPSISPLTLDGMTITGGFIEMQTGGFYVAAAGSKNLRAVRPGPDRTPGTALPMQMNYDRDLVAGSIGWGAKDSNYIHLNLLYAKDASGSAPAGAPAFQQTPQQNALAGFTFRRAFLNGLVRIEGETAASVLALDVHKKALDGAEVSRLVSLESYGGKDVASDLAYRFKTEFRPDKSTTLRAIARKIGPNYRSLGVPFLRTDVLSIRGEGERKFSGTGLTLGGFYQYDANNQNKLDSLSVRGDGLGVKASGRLPMGIFATGEYSFTRLLAAKGGIESQGIQHTLSYTASTAFEAHSFTLNGMHAINNMPHDTLAFSLHNVQAIYQGEVGRIQPSALLGYSRLGRKDAPVTLLTLEAMAGYALKENLQISGGLGLTANPDQGERYSLIGAGSWIFSKSLRWTLRIDASFIRTPDVGIFTTTGQTGFEFLW